MLYRILFSPFWFCLFVISGLHTGIKNFLYFIKNGGQMLVFEDNKAKLESLEYKETMKHLKRYLERKWNH